MRAKPALREFNMVENTSPLPTRPFTDAYLFAYSKEHVVYEIDMFFGMVEVLTDSSLIVASSHAVSARLNNALIEAFVIQLRNLIDFLYLERPQPTDVVAGDYCEAGIWETQRPPISSSLDAARVRANKEMAHLTSQRIAGTPPEKAWNPSALATEIKPLLQLFVTKAVPARLSPNVAAAIR
jgi:hypothetical protein